MGSHTNTNFWHFSEQGVAQKNVLLQSSNSDQKCCLQNNINKKQAKQNKNKATKNEKQ